MSFLRVGQSSRLGPPLVLDLAADHRDIRVGNITSTPPVSGLKALKAASDANVGALGKIKRERDDAVTRVECVVCMDRPRAVLFLPCNHLVVCASCATDECPYCSGAVESQITVANAS